MTEQTGLTDAQLAEIEARCEAVNAATNESDYIDCMEACFADVPRLVAEVRRVRAERDAVLALTTNQVLGEACVEFLDDDRRADHYDFQSWSLGYTAAIVAVRRALGITEEETTRP